MKPANGDPPSTYDAVLFISFGGPEKKEDVMPFLENVTHGRGIPKERLLAVAHHYEALGGESPINEITRRQAAALETFLDHTSRPLPVFIGQRHWHPFIEETLQAMKSRGVRQAVGFTTAAHRCEASLERYVNAVEAARERVGDGAARVDFVGPWFDHPLFIDALCQRIRDIPEGAMEADWIFTAHSIPCAMAKESTYVQELRRTAQLVCEKFGKTDWSLAYSSRSGNPRDAWLEPDVCDAIRAKAEQGIRQILLIPIGFVADHVEVLFDLDVEARAAADAAGVHLRRARTVGDHPAFVRMMAEVVERRLRGTAEPEQRSSAFTRYQNGQRENKAGASSAVCYCHPDAAQPRCRSARL